MRSVVPAPLRRARLRHPAAPFGIWVFLLASAGCTGAVTAVGGSADQGDDGDEPGRGGAPGIPGRGGSGSGGAGVGGAGSGGAEPSACAPAKPAPKVVDLTPVQYDRAVTRLLPGVTGAADKMSVTFTQGGLFSNDSGNARMTTPHVTALFDGAKQIATVAVASASFPYACARMPSPTAACIDDLLATLLPQAFRRPVPDDERARYRAFYDARRMAEGAPKALERVLQAVVTSPHFVFRTELGAASATGTVSLTPHERAAALSFLLADAPPDAELRAAADDGRLAKSAEVQKQARRLLASADAAPAVSRFFRELFRYDLAAAAPKDAMKYPAFTTELRRDLVDESRRFVEHVLWKGDGKLGSIFASDETVLNGRAAKHYGVTLPADAPFQTVRLPNGQRAGLLTQAAFQATLAGSAKTNPVQRGSFVRGRLLCGEVPEPPDGLVVTPVEDDGQHTMRELLAQHSGDPKCATCHRLMDSIGLTFELYDAVGAFRTSHNGKTIDASGEIVATAATDGKVAGPVELVRKLAGSPDVAACLTRQMWRYVNARHEDDRDECAITRAAATTPALAGDVRETLAALLASDELLERDPSATTITGGER